MENIRNHRIVTSIVISSDEFWRVLRELYGEDAIVEFSLDGIWLGYMDSGDDIDEEEFKKALAEYYGVSEVTSIHADDCDVIGVWISFIQ